MRRTCGALTVAAVGIDVAVRKKQEMEAYQEKLDAAQIDGLVAFVHALK